jgi:hypothetical protein
MAGTYIFAGSALHNECILSPNMPYQLDNKLVVAISSRALFDLTEEHEVFTSKGLGGL